MSQQKAKSKSVKTAVMIAAIIVSIIVAILIVVTIILQVPLLARTQPPQVYHEITLPLHGFTPMPPHPNSTRDNDYYIMPVFFMKQNSTAQIFVRYVSTWDYPNMVNIADYVSAHNGTIYLSIQNLPLSVSVDPTIVPHKKGENYTVAYSLTAKPSARGFYRIGLTGCYNIGDYMDIAIGLNSSQIRPQDIPVRFTGEASCGASGFLEYQIMGFVNMTAEYKPAISMN